MAKKSNHSATELSQTVLKQSKLLDCIQSKKYDPESRKHVALTQRLALFVGANNVTLHLVDNEEFRELLTEFDPQYQIPCRQKLKEKVSITSIVITYVHHQITALQYSIKGGAQGTRWQPSFGIT